MECAIHAEIQVLQMLFVHNPNPFVRDNDGWNVLYYVVANRLLSQHEMRREYMDFIKREQFVLAILDYCASNPDIQRKSLHYKHQSSVFTNLSLRKHSSVSNQAQDKQQQQQHSHHKLSLKLNRHGSNTNDNSHLNNSRDRPHSAKNSKSKHIRQKTPDAVQRQRSSSLLGPKEAMEKAEDNDEASGKNQRSMNNIMTLVRMNTGERSFTPNTNELHLNTKQNSIIAKAHKSNFR